MRHSNPYSHHPKPWSKWRVLFWLFMLFLLACGALIYFHPEDDWKTADRSSSRLAPLPSEEPEAVVQVYAARTFGWRKYFAVHSWMAVKERNADAYTVYQVLGYRLPSTGTSVSIATDIPDRKWFGAEPALIQELRGKAAEKAIPELTVELPPHAVGKDYPAGGIVDLTETGKGVRINFWGIAGASLGLAEGVEISLMGLNAGVDILRPALKLPMIGRVGVPDAPVTWDWWSITLLLLASAFLAFILLRRIHQQRRQARRIPHFRHPRVKTSDRI